MLIKATQKLLAELKINPDELNETPPFFSWHANLITVNRRKAVVLINDATRMTVLLYGLKAPDFKKLDTIICNAIKETMLAFGVEKSLADKYIIAAGAITYTKTDNRGVIAALNKIAELLPYSADKLTQDKFNQISISIKYKNYPFKINSSYLSAEELLPKYMAKLQNGETLMEQEPVLSQKAFQFMVRLDLDDFNIWRRVIVPANITFYKLHFVLQDCFNWQNCHLYDFRIFDNTEQGEQIALVSNDDESLEYYEEDKKAYPERTQLAVFLPKYKRILYSYDYGDVWMHTCELEKVIDDYHFLFPACIDGSGDAPPEDVGGEQGFADFLKAINDKSHPEHADMLEWGESQLFDRYDMKKINIKLRHSLKRKY